MLSVKRPGERVKLRYVDWTGPLPEAGDVLITSTGRRYEIEGVTGRNLHCRVLRRDVTLVDDTRVFHWRWNAKR